MVMVAPSVVGRRTTGAGTEVYVDARLPLAGKEEQAGAKQEARRWSRDSRAGHRLTITDAVLTHERYVPSLCVFMTHGAPSCFGFVFAVRIPAR
jgi:hypothetical protein